MGKEYVAKNRGAVHFVTFKVYQWVDVFTRRIYWEIPLDSLRFCQVNKGLEVFAWVIMSKNHMKCLFAVFFSLIFFSCEKKETEFSFKPTQADKPLLVSEIGERLDIIEVQTKYPISGYPAILKSDRYFYLFEEGLVTSLHQVGLDGKVRKSIDFGNDDKLNALSITQIVTK